jgi:hypothetical protein
MRTPFRKSRPIPFQSRASCGASERTGSSATIARIRWLSRTSSVARSRNAEPGGGQMIDLARALLNGPEDPEASPAL